MGMRIHHSGQDRFFRKPNDFAVDFVLWNDGNYAPIGVTYDCPVRYKAAIGVQQIGQPGAVFC